MLKYSLVIVLYFLFFRTGISQGFVNLIDYYANSELNLTGVKKEDNHIWTLGRTYDTLFARYTVQLRKYDQNGKIIFTSNLIPHKDNYYFPKSMWVLNKSIFFLCLTPYTSSTILRYDIESDTFSDFAWIKSQLKSATFFSSRKLAIDNDSNFYVCSGTSSDSFNTRYSTAQVDKIDKFGKWVWTYNINVPKYHVIPTSIVINRNEEVIIACQQETNSFHINDPNALKQFFIHLDNNGSFIKKVILKREILEVKDFVNDQSGSYVCATADTVHSNRPDAYSQTPILAKFDSLGKLVWNIKMTERNLAWPNISMKDVLFDNQTNSYFTGGIGNFKNRVDSNYYERNLILANISENGNLKWLRRTELGSGYVFDNLQAMDLSDDNLYVCGQTNIINLENTQGKYYSFLMKVNKWGCLTDYCSEYQEKDDVQLFITPNPVNKAIQIYSNLTGNATLEFYNINGICLKREFIEFQNGYSRLEVDFLPTGFYLLRCISNLSSSEKAIKFIKY